MHDSAIAHYAGMHDSPVNGLITQMYKHTILSMNPFLCNEQYGTVVGFMCIEAHYLHGSHSANFCN